VLVPPDDLREDDLLGALAAWWGVRAVSAAYRPVGFGSHRWEVLDTGGARRFVTVDELETKRRSAGEPLDAAYHRLRASLAAAGALRASGRAFAVAPVAARDGEPLARLGERYAVAVYPYVDGRSFG
jgi:spectinomycin phosphotransferase/16S rRNA (guanine(1405)-N(7))-methyltransferase